MIRGVKKDAVPYVLEDDRGNPIEEQTVFYIVPKTGHDSNKTAQRYAGAIREGRGGKREISVQKMDSADVEEFLAVVSKVQNYGFPEGHRLYDPNKGMDCETDNDLAEVCRTLSSDHLQEVFDAANNVNRLSISQKKS